MWCVVCSWVDTLHPIGRSVNALSRAPLPLTCLGGPIYEKLCKNKDLIKVVQSEESGALVHRLRGSKWCTS